MPTHTGQPAQSEPCRIHFNYLCQKCNKGTVPPTGAKAVPVNQVLMKVKPAWLKDLQAKPSVGLGQAYRPNTIRKYFKV